LKLFSRAKGLWWIPLFNGADRAPPLQGLIISTSSGNPIPESLPVLAFGIDLTYDIENRRFPAIPHQGKPPVFFF
jgi:hypothetical protein